MRRRRGRKHACGSRTTMPLPLRPNDRWSMDFVADTFGASRRLRILAINDDCCRESLCLMGDTSISGVRVARELDTLVRLGVTTLYIEPGSPWENGDIESFDARLRDELLNGEIFCSLEEVRAVTGWWRDHYNRARPQSSLGYRPPAPETIRMPAWPLASATLCLPSKLASEAHINQLCNRTSHRRQSSRQ